MTRAAFVSVLFVAALAGGGAPAHAQDSSPFDVSGHVVAAGLRQLDAREVGISGRVGWRPAAVLTVETEVSFFPSDEPGPVPVTSSRTEWVAGVTVGPSLGRWRPFARLRPGVLRFGEAPHPVACILIFPPPLACQLAAGRSLLLLDAGGGVEMDLSARTFLRVDVGDRMVRYPGPSFGRGRRLHDRDYFGHDLRLGLGAGWRF